MKSNLFFALLPLAVLSACGSGDKTETVEDNRVLVRVDTIKMTDVQRTVEYTANLEANEQVYLAPSLTGSRIRKINVEVGDKVHKGQLLVQMDNNNLTQSELQLKNYETEYNRAVKLMETGSISQQSYDQIVTQYEVAKEAIDNLKENTNLISPFNGYVTGRYMEEGELYSGGAYGGASKPAVLALEEVSPIKATVNISEQYYLDIKNGMEVHLTSDIYPNRTFVGKVNFIYPSIDAASRTFSVELIFPNQDESLRPGMWGTVAFQTGRAKTIVVQSMTVLKVQGSNDRYIFLAKDGKAERITVKITNRYDDKVEIQPLDGEIKEGDLIVSTGQAKLVDQSPINIVTKAL